MSAFFEQHLWVPFVLFLVVPTVLIVVGNMLLRSRAARQAVTRAEEQRAAAKQAQERQQINYGYLMHEHLTYGCRLNEVYGKDLTGQPLQSAGKPYAAVIPDNGGAFSILVQAERLHTGDIFNPVQVTIDLSRAGKEIHVHYGAYGDTAVRPISDFARVAAELVEYVRYWSPFGQHSRVA